MSNNFVVLCYAMAKKSGLDTTKMTPEEVIDWYNKNQEKTQAKEKIKSSVSKIKDYENSKQDNQQNKQENKNHIQLPKQEYAELCSAIKTKHTNKIPKQGGILYKNSYYMYNYNNSSEQILCIEKVDISGNEEVINMLEEEYGKNK